MTCTNCYKEDEATGENGSEPASSELFHGRCKLAQKRYQAESEAWRTLLSV